MRVYSTGNGSVADVGWVANAGGTGVEESYPDAATLIDRLNINPPRIERGVSMMLQGPRPPADEVVAYNAESGWAEAWGEVAPLWWGGPPFFPPRLRYGFLGFYTVPGSTHIQLSNGLSCAIRGPGALALQLGKVY